MFGKRLKLFKLFGFEVRVDFSWIIIAVLIAWSLSTGLFPFHYKGLSAATYWMMGIIGALGLFISIIIHEFAHSLVARNRGMQMKGITLFIFGGVAEMGEEPPSPGAEFTMAVVGPLSSMALAGLFYGIAMAAARFGSGPITGVLSYLAMINALLALFNLVPAFPLDGGRMLRSILWGIKKNINWATRISSHIGTGFSIFLIIMGVVSVLRGNFIGGMWWFLIGMFLYNAARGSYQRLLIRRALEGEPIRRFMKSDPITVPPDLSVDRLLDNYIYEYHFKMLPVVGNGNRLLGCVTTRDVKELPREEWNQKKVGEIAHACSEKNTIQADEDATKALSTMNSSRASRLMVVEGERLVGVVSLKDMLAFLSLKVELEE